MSATHLSGARPALGSQKAPVRAALLWLCAAAMASLAPAAQAFDAAPRIVAAEGTVQAAFAPWDDVESLLIEAIAQGRKQVLMQAYLLTNKKIAQALIDAHRRGVDVRVLADQLQGRGDSARLGMLAAAGIPVWLETRYENAHNKIIVIDAGSADATLITGSFNFTWAAQHKNAENVLIMRHNPALAARYAMNWERHRLDATAFVPR